MNRLGTALVVAAFFFAPLSGLRAIPPPPTISVADALLLAGVAVLAPVLLRQRLQLPMPYVVGSLILLFAALVNTLLVADPASNISAARVVYAAIFLPTLIALWAPGPRTIGWLAGAYVCGTLYSLGYGLVSGPLPNDRYLGLGIHPNALGHSCALAVTLLPALAHRFPRRRWWFLLVAATCLVGAVESGSRGSVLAILVIGLVYVALEQSIVLGLLGALVGALGLALWPAVVSAAQGNAVLDRLIGQGDAPLSDQQRLDNLSTALVRFNEHPLLGSGFTDLRLAHNSHLEILVAVGVVGFVGWLLVVLALAAPLLRRSDPRHLLAYPAIFLVMVGSFEVVFETLHWAPIALSVLAWPRRQEHPT